MFQNSILFNKLLASLPVLHCWNGKWHPGGFSEKHLTVFNELLSKIDHPKIIETGAGRTTLAFLCTTPAYVTSISPDPALGNRIVESAKSIGIPLDPLRYHTEFSERLLPFLALQENETYDFALIDGGHGYPLPFVDFCYINMMLVQDGYLVVDDLGLHSCGELFRLLEKQPGWELIERMDKCAVFKKLTAEKCLPEWNEQPYLLEKKG